jgi:hypothetical protein
MLRCALVLVVAALCAACYSWLPPITEAAKIACALGDCWEYEIMVVSRLTLVAAPIGFAYYAHR